MARPGEQFDPWTGRPEWARRFRQGHREVGQATARGHDPRRARRPRFDRGQPGCRRVPT